MNTAVASAATQPAERKGGLWWLGRMVAGLLVLILVLAGYAFWRMNDAPMNLDTSTTRTTVNGLYQVSYVPSSSPVPINRLHTWVLTLTTSDGQPVEGARITVDGDMPQHGHGLPTRPHVTRELGHGQYLVEGVKFQMGGWWVMDFGISTDSGTDSVRFNLLLTR